MSMKDKDKTRIEKEVEASMTSLDNLQRAEPDHFFYTRLEARMEREQNQLSGPIGFFANVKWSVALLSLFAILNVASFFLLTSGNSQTDAEQASLDSFSEEYFSSNLYQYENED